MKRHFCIFALFLATFFGSFSLDAQKADPELLTFRKTYQMPGMSQEEIYRFSRSWTDESLDSTSIGEQYGYEGENYYIHYPVGNLNGKPGRILGFVSLNFRDNFFELILSDICIFLGNNSEMDISVRDDKSNRTRLWFLMHNEKAIEIARGKAADAFEALQASIDKYLMTGPEDTFELSALK